MGGTFVPPRNDETAAGIASSARSRPAIVWAFAPPRNDEAAAGIASPARSRLAIVWVFAPPRNYWCTLTNQSLYYEPSGIATIKLLLRRTCGGQMFR